MLKKSYFELYELLGKFINDSKNIEITEKAADMIADGRAAQTRFCEVIFAGFSKEEMEKLQQFTEHVNRNAKEYMKD